MLWFRTQMSSSLEASKVLKLFGNVAKNLKKNPKEFWENLIKSSKKPKEIEERNNCDDASTTK